MPEPNVDSLIKQAEGNIEEHHLTSDGGTDNPIIEYLEDDEHPQFIFKHPGKGIRVIKGQEKSTPYNSEFNGDRIYLITDKRILFIAGQGSSSDVIHSFSYQELSDVESKKGILKYRISISYEDGLTIDFYDSGKRSSHLDDATDYVRRQLSKGNDFSPSYKDEIRCMVFIDEMKKQLDLSACQMIGGDEIGIWLVYNVTKSGQSTLDVGSVLSDGEYIARTFGDTLLSEAGDKSQDTEVPDVQHIKVTAIISPKVYEYVIKKELAKDIKLGKVNRSEIVTEIQEDFDIRYPSE